MPMSSDACSLASFLEDRIADVTDTSWQVRKGSASQRTWSQLGLESNAARQRTGTTNQAGQPRPLNDLPSLTPPGTVTRLSRNCLSAGYLQ